MASTFSRAAIVSFLISAIFSYCLYVLIINIRDFKFSTKLKLKNIFIFISSFTLISASIPGFLAYSRFSQITNSATALWRLKVYFDILETISKDIFQFMFGYFINSEAMINESRRLYVTDSSYAFLLSNVGLLGTIFFLFTFFSISFNLLKNKYIFRNKLQRYNLFGLLWLISYLFISFGFDPSLLDAKCLFMIGLILSVAEDNNNISISNKFAFN